MMEFPPQTDILHLLACVSCLDPVMHLGVRLGDWSELLDLRELSITSGECIPKLYSCCPVNPPPCFQRNQKSRFFCNMFDFENVDTGSGGGSREFLSVAVQVREDIFRLLV